MFVALNFSLPYLGRIVYYYWGSLRHSQIDKIVYGARDLKRGAGNHGNKLYHPSSLVLNGVLEEDCAQLMKDFFYEKRKQS